MADNPITAAAGETEKKVKGIRPYLKAHWKELLALVLAAIPAAFIVFHKGARQAAVQAAQPLLNAVPGGAGSPGSGPSGGGDPGTSIATPSSSSSVVTAAQSALGAMTAAPSSSLGISVNGSNPTRVAVPPKAAPAPVTSSYNQRLLSLESHDVQSQLQSTAPVQPALAAPARNGYPAVVAMPNLGSGIGSLINRITGQVQQKSTALAQVRPSLPLRAPAPPPPSSPIQLSKTGPGKAF